MMIFHCTDCKETINCPDDEGPAQVFARLDEHIAKCPLAQFNFEGTTEHARQRVDDIRAVIAYNRAESKLRLTDQGLSKSES
jgi:hypothetical protein